MIYLNSRDNCDDDDDDKDGGENNKSEVLERGFCILLIYFFTDQKAIYCQTIKDGLCLISCLWMLTTEDDEPYCHIPYISINKVWNHLQLGLLYEAEDDAGWKQKKIDSDTEMKTVDSSC